MFVRRFGYIIPCNPAKISFSVDLRQAIRKTLKFF